MRKLSVDRIMELVESNMSDCTNIGICRACGFEQDGCEPDARNYLCENCQANEVFGAEELLLMYAV